MDRAKNRGVILFCLLLCLLVYFGRWDGQVNQETTDESGANGLFLLIFVPILLGIIYIFRLWRYWVVLLPVRREIFLFLFTGLVLSLFREEIVASLRNMTAIFLIYVIILSLSVISFSIPINRLFNVLIFFIVFVFLPSTVFVHITKVGPLNLFPNRLENNNLRLGGLFYYAHTAMILGMGGLLSLYMIFIQHKKWQRIYYSCLFILLNVFLLFTDCRSSWGGVALAYVILSNFFISTYKRWVLVGLCLISIFFMASIGSSNEASKQYQTGDDFMFRTMIWNFAFEGIYERPLTGYSTKIYFSRNKKAMDLNDRISDPHSATLSLALQSGLLIVFLFYKLYFRMARLYYIHSSSNKSLLAVSAFWLFVPFFWGGIYNGTAGFIQIFFPLTCFVCFMHPQFYNIPVRSKNIVNRFGELLKKPKIDYSRNIISK